MTELVFVSAPGCSLFMVELLEVIARAVRDQGGDARCVTGRLAAVAADADSVFVVIPHEYLAIDPEPPAALLRRTIAFGVEHPGTASFDASVAGAHRFAALFEINRASVDESRRRGLAPHLFALGNSPLWGSGAALDGAAGQRPSADRPVDVLHMGTLDPRRAALISGYASDFAGLRTRLLLPPHEPMTAPRPDFLVGEGKRSALGAAKVLLNLHRAGSSALEWVRVLEALANGCVVVSERSIGYEPLVPGVHCFFGGPHSLGAVAARLVADPDRLDQVRADVTGLLGSELDMGPYAISLMNVAQSIAGSGAAASSTPSAERRRTRQGHAPPAVAAAMAEWMPVASDAEQRPAPPTERARSADGFRGPVDAGAVIEHRFFAGGPPEAPAAAVHLVAGFLSGDGPVEVTAASLLHDPVRWTMAAAAAPMVLGLEPDHDAVLPTRGALRNAALGGGRAEWIAVLDPGDEFLPGGLLRLLESGAESGADIVVGMAAHPGGLLNALPPEQRRLDIASYLSRGYLIRRSLLTALGGWSEDPLLGGMTDHDLWQRALAAEAAWAFEPSITTRFWRQAPRLRPVDVDPAAVWSELRRRARRPVGRRAEGVGARIPVR